MSIDDVVWDPTTEISLLIVSQTGSLEKLFDLVS